MGTRSDILIFPDTKRRRELSPLSAESSPIPAPRNPRKKKPLAHRGGPGTLWVAVGVRVSQQHTGFGSPG